MSNLKPSLQHIFQSVGKSPLARSTKTLPVTRAPLRFATARRQKKDIALDAIAREESGGEGSYPCSAN
ncbi:hypothetical protein F4775DRAFT_590360 [Biscogniauxia sp. FL1348]|nr:hypothetical protein F4775DRAFT_590360 [Biscogniauxia sp. FL1348]